MEDLHARLAAAGVPLFDAPASEVVVLDRAGLADLIRDLLAEDSPSLAVVLPCVFVAQDSHAAAAVVDAAQSLGSGARRRLGLLYRLARCLAASRRPDVEHYIGRPVTLPSWDGEPADLPDPAERYGHSCLREARDEEENPGIAGVAGDAERTFDQWLRILAVEGGRP